jgi:hypothetical protein
MVTLQIRDVPEELRDRLAKLAEARGQSPQAYPFDVVSDEARRQDNLAVLDRFPAPMARTWMPMTSATNFEPAVPNAILNVAPRFQDL